MGISTFGMRKNDAVKYIFITLVVVANFTAYKLISIFGLIGPAGVFASAATFLCTDIISELEGKESAQRLVKYGFLCALVASLILVLVDFIPYPAFAEVRALNYHEVASSSVRIMLSGLTAYLVSQNLDLHLFHWLRDKYEDHKWIRNNGSTLISQLFDTCIFVTLAFIGTIPLTQLIGIIVGQYLMKMGLSLLDTPLFYLLTKDSKAGN